MLSKKKDILNKLSSEVNDFHPLLSALFQKLPNIQNVEYTHGPNEKGSDFVLT
jgi:hypothetical protein